MTKLKTISNRSKLETLNSPGKALQGSMLVCTVASSLAADPHRSLSRDGYRVQSRGCWLHQYRNLGSGSCGLACWFVCFNTIAALAAQNQTAAFRIKSAQGGITFEFLGEI